MRLALACLAIASGHAFRAPTSTLRPTRSWAAPKRPTTALAVAADAGAGDRQLGVRVGGVLCRRRSLGRVGAGVVREGGDDAEEAHDDRRGARELRSCRPLAQHEHLVRRARESG